MEQMFFKNERFFHIHLYVEYIMEVTPDMAFKGLFYDICWCKLEVADSASSPSSILLIDKLVWISRGSSLFILAVG